MLIRDLNTSEKIIAADQTILRQLLHPEKMDLDLRYSLAHAVVLPGETSIPHQLRSSEVYYILEGEGIMHIGDESAPVKPGMVVYIPPLATQSIHNPGTTDLVFLCIVDPAWRAEDEVVF